VLVASATAQYLEKTIWIVDSLCGLDGKRTVIHNPVTNRMYFVPKYSSRLHLFDCATKTKHGCVHIEGSAWSCTDAVQCPEAHRLYVSCGDGNVLVFDDQTDSLVRTVRLTSAISLAYNPGMGRVYVGMNNSIAVLDASSGEPITTIRMLDDPDVLVYESVNNMLYAMTEYWSSIALTVVDCNSDSVTLSLAAPELHCFDMLVHRRLGKLYLLAGAMFDGHVWVYNLDSLQNGPVGSISPTPTRSYGRELVADPDSHYMYIVRAYERFNGPQFYADEPDSFMVVDCRLDSIVRFLYPGEWPTSYRAFFCDDSTGRRYMTFSLSDSIMELDSAGRVTGGVKTGVRLCDVGWNPQTREVYARDWDGFLHVYDMPTRRVTARVDYRLLLPRDLYWTSAGQRLYFTTYDGVGVLGPDDSLRAYTDLGYEYVYFLAYSAELSRLYVVSEVSERIVGYDCTHDSVVKDLWARTAHRVGIHLPEYHKIYSRWMVYDTYQDTFTTYGYRFGWPHAYNPRSGFAYGSYRDSGFAVIEPRTDSILGHVAVGHDVRRFVANTALNEIWFFTEDNRSRIRILSCDNHQVVDSVELPSELFDLVWLEDWNRLYAVCTSSVFVVECRSRQHSGTIPLGTRYRNYGWRHVLDRRNHKLYVADTAKTFVVDVFRDSVVAEFDTPYASEIAWNPVDSRVYVCSRRDNRIWVFRDEVTGESEKRLTASRRYQGAATIVHNSLPLRWKSPAELLDIAGRRVMSLQPGINDIRHVAPGVYFVRREEDNTTTKVVIQR
jgi:DNA-binding beta-propeller fold protein YncE